MTRETKLKFILLAGSTFVTAVLLEIGLQIADFPGDQTNMQAFLIPDTTLGWSVRPNASGVYRSDEYTHDLAFDDAGFRVAQPGDTETPREGGILILGDSFVNGYSVSYDDWFATHMEEDLRASGCSADLVAWGAPGFNTTQQYLWLSQNADRLQPRLVVLLFYFNDVWYNDKARYGIVKIPRLDLSADEGPSFEYPGPIEPRPPAAPGRRAVLDRIKLYRLAEFGAKAIPPLRAIARALGLYESQEAAFEAGTSGAPAEFRVFRTDDDPERESAWASTEALLALTDSLVTASGGELMIGYIPTRAEVREGEDRGLGQLAAENGWDLAAVETRLAASCQELGLSCFSLTGALANARAEQGQPMYYELDTHWSPAGQAVVAESVRREIETRSDVCSAPTG